MPRFTGRQPHSLPLGLLFAVMGALLLQAAVAPRANAEVDANFVWTGVVNSTWITSGNWTPGGPPGAGDTAVFNQAFLTQPNLTIGSTVGTVWMTTGITRDVTIASDVGSTLSLSALGIVGTGILVDNTSAFTLTITANIDVNNSQAWTNNSGNVFTVGGNVSLLGNSLTVNGTGNTLISGVMGVSGSLTKDGSGTLTLTGTNIYSGDTTVNGGTLLVNNAAGSGTGSGAVTVNNSGTLGGTGTISGTVTVNAGGTIAPGNGGNNTGTLQTGALTLAGATTFRVDINGATPGTFDQLQVNTGVVALGTTSTLVVTVGATLAVGQTFMILNKVSTGNSTGIFAGIPQGGTVVGSNGTVFSVSYTAGTDGNDIVLTVVAAPVPEPSTWMGGALAMAGLAFTQRRKLRKLIAFSR